jgi:NAD(P)-dependent dehydrogenase (short-subunit alcohol dehydrogenase family)
MKNLSKKIALVTGSATRIGGIIATYLAKRSWSVILHYNNSKDEAMIMAEKLAKITDVFLIKADLSSSLDAQSLIPIINQKFGIVNLLINNASYFQNDNLENLDDHILNKHLQINLNASLILSKYIAKQQPNLKANIINLLDCSIANPTINFLSYKISKSALAYATKSLALSLAPFVRVNAICPGPVLASSNQSASHFNDLCKNTPLGYSATTLEICRTIDFILKTKSITGQLIFLDGGVSLTEHIDY